MELLSGLVNGVHLSCLTTRAADSNEFLLVYFVCNFRKFAVSTADILHDELVKVADHVTHVMLTFNDCGALRIST